MFFEKLENFLEIFNKYNNKKDLKFSKKILIIFGATSLNAFLISSLLYPLDTYKRNLQVNGSMGFLHENSSLVKFFQTKNFSLMYAGFSMHALKSIPFSIIHYTIYKSMQQYSTLE